MQDKIIIGAGLYGLYAALFCAKRDQKVTVIEIEKQPFSRATYINQARVHMGYHYPRSLATAMKSAGYFKRFVEDYPWCMNTSFAQVYATSSHFSWTDATEFQKFCRDAGIMCEELPVSRYFKSGMCDGAFLTEEYSYDAMILRDYFVTELAKYPNVTICYERVIDRIVRVGDCYEVYATYEDKRESYRSSFILNATYAGVNEILSKVESDNRDPFGIKYEMCEIILCKVDDALKNIGLTVMDGPFFSIMPFGKTGYHSLTSVAFTPHKTSYEEFPTFACNTTEMCRQCTAGKGSFLANCNDCNRKPETAWDYMSALAHKYMRKEYGFTYEKSLFSMKPILKASEIDDSRPTVIKYLSNSPTFVSVLSGKINTVYDLDEILE